MTAVLFIQPFVYEREVHYNAHDAAVEDTIPAAEGKTFMTSDDFRSSLTELSAMITANEGLEVGPPSSVNDRTLYDLSRNILNICASLYDRTREEGKGELLDPITSEESKHPRLIDASIVPLSGRDDPFLDDYVKWLALYSEMSIFVMPFAMECVDITYSSHYGAELEKSWKDLKTLVRYSRQYRQLLDSGMGVFLPAENTYTLTSYSDHRTDTYKAPLTQVPDQYIYTPINSRSNIFMGTSFQDFMVYKEIVLPYFKIPRLDELIKIAKNETQSFVKFNHFLAKKLANISKADSGTKLQEILREIDYEVANIELEFKRLGRLRVLQGVEMAFFSISLSALLFADADLVKQIAGVSGSVSLLEIFKGFFSRSEQGSSVKTNDFYLPYLLKTKNG